jgi:hypothetical protein
MLKWEKALEVMNVGAFKVVFISNFRGKYEKLEKANIRQKGARDDSN